MLGIGALAVSTAVNYLIVYMPTYVVKTLNLPPIVGFEATLAGGHRRHVADADRRHRSPTGSGAPPT